MQTHQIAPLLSAFRCGQTDPVQARLQALEAHLASQSPPTQPGVVQVQPFEDSLAPPLAAVAPPQASFQPFVASTPANAGHVILGMEQQARAGENHLDARTDMSQSMLGRGRSAI